MIYYVYTKIDGDRTLTTQYKRDRAFRAMRHGVVRSGVRVVDTTTAAQAAARKTARAWGRTAEVLIHGVGSTSDGGTSFIAEIWTRRRSRLASKMHFAIVRVE